MNATQAENLRILIRHMDGLKRTLDMTRVTGDCGTPSCAFGEAACMTHFNNLGLKPLKRRATSGVEWRGREVMMGECSDEIFGTEGNGYDIGTRARLFGSGSRNAWRRDAVTPQEWAVEARKVLCENGYSMDEAKAIPSVRERLDAIYAAPLTEKPEDYHAHPLFGRALY